MTEEVRANLSFSNLRRGDRLQVDIHDPQVAGLIKAGYLKIIWKEPREHDPVDSGRVGGVPDSGVDGGVARPAQTDKGKSAAAPRSSAAKTAVSDGQGEHRPGEKGADSTQAGRSAHTPDK